MPKEKVQNKVQIFQWLKKVQNKVQTIQWLKKKYKIKYRQSNGQGKTQNKVQTMQWRKEKSTT